MNETLIIALSSGGIAALVTLIGNTIINKSNNNKDMKSKKIIAYAIIEDLLCKLGTIKTINNNRINQYFKIFENIENLDSYMNSIRQINKYRFYLISDILREIETIESTLRNITANYYTNYGNDEYSLIDDGVEWHNNIINFRDSLRGLIDEQYEKLK